MGGLFSSLSKQLLGSLVLSAGLPAVAFVLVLQALVIPSLPETWHVLEAPEALHAEWKTAFVALGVLLVATLLTTLNGPIIRLYEGYPLIGSWIGTKMTERHRRRAEEAEIWRDGARSILRAVDRLRQQQAQQTEVEGAAELGELWQQVNQVLPAAYPHSKWVLPTRLGNIIRAFEYYPLHKYGIYGVTTWPRLSSVIDETYAKHITDTKQPFDFMLNCSIVSYALAALTVVSGLAWPAHRGLSWLAWGGWLALVVLLGLAGWACYRLSIPRAAAWGDTVKSAYDLYRRELLKKLGFSALPRTMEEEKALWRAIGGHMLFGRMATASPLVYTEEAARVEKDNRWLRALRELVS